VGSGDAALVLADVGERPDPGHVADRPQALAGAHPGIDIDLALAGVEADGLEADALDARAAAGGDEHPIAPQLRPLLELEHVVLAVAPGTARVLAEPQLDALGLERLAERLAERPRRARKHPVL